MALEMRQPFSDTVSAIGFDPETSELVVEWKDVKPGKPGRSIYVGVTPEVAQQVMNAPSVGSAIHNLVKSTSAHRYG